MKRNEKEITERIQMENEVEKIMLIYLVDEGI